MPEAEGRALIDQLMAIADDRRFIHSHPWKPHDMVPWDNRSVPHRATPYPVTSEKRLMIRTTIAGDGPTVPPLPADG